MARKFEPDRVVELGWRQGAILDRRLAELAWERAPERVSQGDHDHLLVTSSREWEVEGMAEPLEEAQPMDPKCLPPTGHGCESCRKTRPTGKSSPPWASSFT